MHEGEGFEGCGPRPWESTWWRARRPAGSLSRSFSLARARESSFFLSFGTLVRSRTILSFLLGKGVSFGVRIRRFLAQAWESSWKARGFEHGAWRPAFLLGTRERVRSEGS